MENLPVIWGLPLFVWGGLFGLGVVLFQVLSGLRVIKVTPKNHKIGGIALLIISIIHGLAGLAYFL